jgi:hypothetical protein
MDWTSEISSDVREKGWRWLKNCSQLMQCCSYMAYNCNGFWFPLKLSSFLIWTGESVQYNSSCMSHVRKNVGKRLMIYDIVGSIFWFLLYGCLQGDERTDIITTSFLQKINQVISRSWCLCAVWTELMPGCQTPTSECVCNWGHSSTNRGRLMVKMLASRNWTRSLLFSRFGHSSAFSSVTICGT